MAVAPPEFAQLTVNGRELQIIYAGLDELPGKISRELYDKIRSQVQAQIAAHEAAQPPAP